MSNKFNFNNIIKGQQLKIFFDKNETIMFKTENASQGTRFVVFGETLEGEKVLIPAFTAAELDTKYRYVDNGTLQRNNNCIKWISKNRFGIVTHRFLDVEEIYLLNSEGNLKRYDGAFDGKLYFEKSKFYVSKEATYDFNDIKLFFLKAKVRDILLKNNKGRLPIDENISLIQQALVGIGEDSQLDNTTKLLTMKERVTLFIEAINQLPEVIDLFVYYQESENKEILDINDVILQSELLHKLNIKTGFNFTKEELAKFKIKLKVIENNEDDDDILTVQLNLAYKVDDNDWNRNFSSSEFQIKTKLKDKVSLLFNLHCGNLSMISMKLMSMQEEKKEASFFLN